ncbi:hypothetical protein P43SY_010424 [Pythium insidiosum]|uniref:Ricin B lectin domain-containing protein n=1 Tax=Pythium insidiosum TaxID=114742 RepID=A0AAD5LPJ9_PYTIN|nr:hypothetical protein P43SY_010424 [Pythium insidiosum]
MAKTQTCVALTGDAKSVLMKTCDPSDSAQQWYLSKSDKCLSPDYIAMKDKLPGCGLRRRHVLAAAL